MALFISAYRFRWPAILLMLVSFVVGYTIATPGETRDLEPETAYQTDEEAAMVSYGPRSQSLTGAYLAARYAGQQNEVSDSAHYLLEALRHDSRNLDLRRDTVRQLVIAGESKLAIEQVNKIPAMVHTHPLTRLVMLTHYLDEQDYEKAEALLKVHNASGMLGVLQPVVSQWIALGKSGQATHPEFTYESVGLEKSKATQAIFDYHLALLNQHGGHIEAADRYYGDSIKDLNAIPVRIVYSYVSFLLRQNEETKAQALLDRYHEAYPGSDYLPATVSAWKNHMENKNYVSSPEEGVAEVLFSVASILFGEHAESDTRFYLQLSNHIRPDFAPSLLMLARMSEESGNSMQAIQEYSAIDTKSVYAPHAMLRIAINHHALEKHDAALEILNVFNQEYGERPDGFTAQGDIHRYQENYEAAAEAYGKAIALYDASERQVHWQLYYARGVCYERAGNWNAAEVDLQKALELSPTQPDVLNYLAYSWIEQDKNLLKAQRYLDQAVRLRPDAPHIIDSMGWAYYKLGQFEQAVKYLERAVLYAPNDPTINDHLGDAYYRVGREKEAEFQWKRALTFDEGGTFAEGIQAKLDAGMPRFIPPKNEALQASEESAARQIPGVKFD